MSAPELKPSSKIKLAFFQDDKQFKRHACYILIKDYGIVDAV